LITSRSILLVRSTVMPHQIGVAFYAVKSRVTGLHSGGAVRVNNGSWSKVMA
jgi:hypothetical protein